MKKAFEEKFLTMILFDVRKIFNKENSTITKNYYDCYNYLCDIIDTVSGNASEFLLTELQKQREFYKHRYLINKGLI